MKTLLLKFATFVSFLLPAGSHAERINQEGRILGPLPLVTNSILFNTTNADAIVSAMQIFPVTHGWNEDVARRPVLTNSDAMIATIISDLSASRRFLIAFQEMNFVLIPDTQALAQITFDLPPEFYPGDSDPGPYPIPSNMPVEGWPRETGSLTLSQWQQDPNNIGGDRHAIVAQPGTGLLWEMWRAKYMNGLWRAGCGAKWDMNSNVQHEAGLTSADAAGLPMLGGLVRYDECQRGMVEHACRIVVGATRGQFIYPASHKTGSNTNTNRPAMGQRVRLKSNYVIPANWSVPEKAVLKAMKKYGAIVSDNGGFFSISAVPDNRWAANEFKNLTNVAITNFEVIVTTSENEGPRSPNSPVASAGADQSVVFGEMASLQGFVNFVGAPPTNRWKFYSGPGAVMFGNASQTNTTASFSAPGIYTLMLSAEDGVHAVAYDAVVITVTTPIHLSVARENMNLNLSWTGAAPSYVLEQSTVLPAEQWSGVVTTISQNVSVPITNSTVFFRVKAQ